jgi:hypothetical protein
MRDEPTTAVELRLPSMRPYAAHGQGQDNLGEAESQQYAAVNALGRELHPGDIVNWFEISGRPTRLLHLPVLDAKHSRRHLQARLPAALQFVSHHLANGRQVLIHDSDGKS